MANLGLDKYPWYGQLAIFLLLAAGGAAAFYYLYEMPQQQQLAARQTEVAGIRARNAQGAETARKLPAFKAQIGELEARLDALKPILPEEKDVGDLLRRIQTLATQSNLTIRGFRPQPIATREIHAEWPIGLELEGSYHNLGAFLDRVSRFPRIINVGDLAITARAPNPSQDSPSRPGSIVVSCTATTFVLVEQTPSSSAAAAKGTTANNTASAPGPR